jgi:di/tricarboxylate transporter
MAKWWENQFELIRTDWLAFLMQGEPVAIVLLLVVILFGYLTWIGIRVVWEHFRDR